MSLQAREDKAKPVQVRQYGDEGRRHSDLRKENFSKNVIEARLREAVYKDSIGMQLTQYDDFLLQNKEFFKQILKRAGKKK